MFESITEPSKEKQNVLLRRMFLLIKDSLQLLNEDLQQKQWNELTKIQHNTNKVDRYDNFNRRAIAKQHITEEKVNFYWTLSNYLHLIQRSILHLYESGNKNKINLNPEQQKLYQILTDQFDKIYQAFFRRDINAINNTNIELKELLYQQIHPALTKAKGQTTVTLYYCGELARLMYLSNSPMIGILSGEMS